MIRNQTALKIEESFTSTFHTDPDPAVFLAGVYEYKCTATGDEAFPDGNRVREGYALFLPNRCKGFLEIVVRGLRLGSSAYEGAPRVHGAVAWHGRGELVTEGSQLRLSYRITADDSRGKTTDEFIFPPQGLPSLIPGTFSHFPKNGPEVTGEVRYKKMRSSGEVGEFLAGFRESATAWSIQKLLNGEKMAPTAEILIESLAKRDPAREGDTLVIIDLVSGRHAYSQSHNTYKAIQENFPGAFSILYQGPVNGTVSTIR